MVLAAPHLFPPQSPVRFPFSQVNALEWRAVFGLGAVYALRMLGMFMVLPVLALYAAEFPGGATPMQVGLAIGAYGLAQALFQIPLGLASDRLGRKPVIYAGMLIFALGSVVAGLADSIGGLTLGRVLQGAGAVSSAVAALLADVTRDQVRTTAMAVLGAGMGLSFVLALVAGPVVSGWIGVHGIFFLTAVLAVLTLPVVAYGVPTPPQTVIVKATGFREAVADRELLRLDAGIFLLHATMTALFTTAPLAIRDTLELESAEHWKVYLPVMLLSILPVFPLIRRAERSGRGAQVYRGSIALLATSMVLAATAHLHPAGLLVAMVLFFVGFNYLEGALPSLISRRAPPARKGAALGVYATMQFLGAFAGGAVGGFARGHFGLGGAFAACAILPIIWLLIPAAGGRPSVADATLKSSSSS